MPAPFDPTSPITVHQPTRQTAPLVFASGHSGRRYEAAFVDSTRLDRLALRRSEDCFVDELFAAVPAYGAPLLTAEFPRAYCDPNRERWELDPAMFDGRLPSWVNTTSARVGAGLGTIPRVVSSGAAIYRDKLSFDEAQARIGACWDPYHAALTDLIAATRAAFGACLLVDCHSMPLHGSGPGAEFVLGDVHGRSCAPAVTAFAEARLRRAGHAVRRNDPYAGGYVTRHYGQPASGIHVLQIEIARSLYMDEARIEKTDGFARVRATITDLVAALAEAAPALLVAR